MKPPNVHGVVVVDKPRGPTSHDIVRIARKRLSTRQIGHTGTLDPMATGVLVLAVGDGTKLVSWLTADDKSYAATIRLGEATDTLDADGTVTDRLPVPSELFALAGLGLDPGPPGPGSSALLEAALATERARTLQVPPAFSAIRVDGERAHDLAREGRLTGDLPPRAVAVRTLTCTGARVVARAADEGANAIEIDVEVSAAKGYFVRSLARDLAQGLGTVGHLTALRRTRAGAFTLADAMAPDAIGPDAILDVSGAAARALPVSLLDAVGVREAGFGRRIEPASITDPHPCPSAFLDAATRRLVAIGECDAAGFGRVLRGFPEASSGP